MIVFSAYREWFEELIPNTKMEDIIEVFDTGVAEHYILQAITAMKDEGCFNLSCDIMYLLNYDSTFEFQLPFEDQLIDAEYLCKGERNNGKKTLIHCSDKRYPQRFLIGNPQEIVNANKRLYLLPRIYHLSSRLRKEIEKQFDISILSEENDTEIIQAIFWEVIEAIKTPLKIDEYGDIQFSLMDWHKIINSLIIEELSDYGLNWTERYTEQPYIPRIVRQDMKKRIETKLKVKGINCDAQRFNQLIYRCMENPKMQIQPEFIPFDKLLSTREEDPERYQRFVNRVVLYVGKNALLNWGLTFEFVE